MSIVITAMTISAADVTLVRNAVKITVGVTTVITAVTV